MKISEINLKEEGAKYYYKEGLENFIVKNGDLVGETSGLDITYVFTIGMIMNIEFERVETVKNPYERVRKEEQYYFTTAYKEVKSDSEAGHELDDKIIKSLNYFNDKNYAEYINFKETLMRRIDKFAWEHNARVIDWKDCCSVKYYIEFSNTQDKLIIEWSCSHQANNIYFTSHEIAKKAIEEFKVDLIKLYTWKFDF